MTEAKRWWLSEEEMQSMADRVHRYSRNALTVEEAIVLGVQLVLIGLVTEEDLNPEVAPDRQEKAS